jgi:hypothetical protein
MALLSGHESRLRAFVAEYVSVVGESAVGVLGSAAATVPGGRRAALGGLARSAYDQLQRTVVLVYAELLRRAVPETRGLPGRPPPRSAAASAAQDLAS